MSMGRFITSFGINVDAINAVFGSKNQKKFASVKKTRTYFHYDEMVGEPSPITVIQAVEDFFFSKLHEAPEAVYSCALLYLCDALRIPVPEKLHIQSGDQIDLINKSLIEDFNMPKTTKIEELIFSTDCYHTFKKSLVMPETFARINSPGYDNMNSPMLALWSPARTRDAQQIFARVHVFEKEIKKLERSKTTEGKLKGVIHRNIRDFLTDVDFCVLRGLGMIHFSY
jgi:hypothetical protein